MKIEYLKKWIKQNRLIELSGNQFVDEESSLVQNLNKEGETALLGIQRKDGVYTILGEDYVYYLSTSGVKGKMFLSEFSDIIQDYGLKKGKIFTRFKYMKINEKDCIWLKNKSTMSALWNTVIWLERETKANKKDAQSQAGASEIK